MTETDPAQSENPSPRESIPSRDPDFSGDIVAALYQYQVKSLPVARLLALVGGILGVHRFYLGRFFTGVLMFLSLGGGLIWWIWDQFRVRAMVQTFNREEAEREAAGLPPLGMGFLPPRDELDFSGPPAWASKRRTRSYLVGSAILLSLVGLAMGTISGSTGHYEATAILLIFIAITLVGARWEWLSTLPVLGGLTRWNHRLRLYYHTVDPGSVWLLALRPIFGPLFAPWRQRSRAEVRLYLQMGISASLVFGLLDLAEVGAADSKWAGIGLTVGEFFQTLAYTYAFVAPVGALLTTQLLLSRRDRVVWVLSAITLGCLYLGLMLVGAV